MYTRYTNLTKCMGNNSSSGKTDIVVAAMDNLRWLYSYGSCEEEGRNVRNLEIKEHGLLLLDFFM